MGEGERNIERKNRRERGQGRHDRRQLRLPLFDVGLTCYTHSHGMMGGSHIGHPRRIKWQSLQLFVVEFSNLGAAVVDI